MKLRKEMTTVKALKALGAKVRIRRRQLAPKGKLYREKTYLTIEAAGGLHTWNTIIRPKIRENFPDAYMTSGSFSEVIEVTVALEK